MVARGGPPVLQSGAVPPVVPLPRSLSMHKRHSRIAIGFVTGVVFLALALVSSGGWAGGKPEDVFKGRIIITKKRLPLRFSSAGAFISAVNSAKTDKLWPTEEDGEKGS